MVQIARQDGISIRQTARELGLARNTVRTYVRGQSPTGKRRQRGSKLDAYKKLIRQCMQQDQCYNVELMFERLGAQGYTGGRSILKEFVRPLRPAQQGRAPVIRYETLPGRQMQFDWGEFGYNDEQGRRRKVYGFTAILGYSRMRYVEFVKRCDVRTLLRCLEHACVFFGGQTERILTDRMKSVLLRVEKTEKIWHPVFAQACAAVGLVPDVCKAYTPQTKGKVERTVEVVKTSFWAGVRFTDLEDLNRQAVAWADRCNSRVHRTTRRKPCDLQGDEQLQPLAPHRLWAPFVREARKVTWDGFISVDGVLYGLPAAAAVAGATVTVEVAPTQLEIWSKHAVIATLPRQTQGLAIHPTQWDGLASAVALKRHPDPLGHQVAIPVVDQRPLAVYDTLCQVRVSA